MDFNGKHICVTGASSGIGLVTARLLGQRGARVSLLARRKELLDEVVAELGPNGASQPMLATRPAWRRRWMPPPRISDP